MINKPIPYILFILLWILQHTLLAQTPEVIFDRANAFYEKQEYKKAIKFYEEIFSQGYESAEIYYNVGNCYYRLNEVGMAILSFEKALLLNPRDPDIQYNLDMANLHVIDRVELPPRLFLFEWWDNLLNYFSLMQLTRLLVIIFILGVISFTIFLFLRRDLIRRYLLIISITLGLLTAFSGYVLFLKSRSYVNHRFGIVLKSSVTAFSAPDENSTDVFIIHEGLKVYLDELRSQWVKISLSDGKSGWIKTDTLGII
jgi:tetratricopeptide (TPR) repeat protein